MTAPTQQLHVYRVQDGALEEFVAEWRARIVPLRRTFGFEILGAWTAADEDTFAWLVSYDGPEGFAARDAEYYASPARTAMEPNPMRHIVNVETWMVAPVRPDDDAPAA